MNEMMEMSGLLDAVRATDRMVLEVARTRDLRPMEAYLLIVLNTEDDPVTTAHCGRRIAASSSQAKQLALALQQRGLVQRIARTGLTQITEDGRKEAIYLCNGISKEISKWMDEWKKEWREL